MIKGLTHDEETGNLHKVTKYKGKISAGFAPGEGPNQTNHPVAAGFFRMLKEQTKTERVGSSQKTVVVKEWILNDEVQKALVETLRNEMPRRVEIVCLYRTPEDMWESSLAMYSRTDGLICKSHGKGTNARFLKLGANNEREWIDREFEGVNGCPYHDCPDFQAGKCKAIGLLKCFPVVDLAPNPYRFETRSINTIIGLESAFQDLWTLLRSAHVIKQHEADKELPFDGFFGMKMHLIHRKIKSGGREVYITDMMPTPEFTALVMEPLQRWIKKRGGTAKLMGAAGAPSLLEEAGQRLLTSQGPEDDIDGPVPMDDSDQRDIAVNFGADADAVDGEATETPSEAQEGPSEGTKSKVASTMLDDVKKKGDS